MVSFLFADVLHHPDVACQLSHGEDNLVSRYRPLAHITPYTAKWVLSSAAL